MSEVLSIMIDNRAEAQNDGPHGYWLDLPTTAEKLQEAMREIHISTDNPQDFFIAGFSYPEDRHLAIPYDMVLTADVDELNFLAARLDTLDAAALAELNAALQNPKSGFENIGQIIDYADNVDYFVHLPDVQSPGQLGDYYLNREPFRHGGYAGGMESRDRHGTVRPAYRPAGTGRVYALWLSGAKRRRIKNIFTEGELVRDSVVAKFATTATDGKTYQVEYYNLDVIISVGYRVKSKRGTQFRIWATGILKEYMRKGFALDDERLKNLGGGGYFKWILQGTVGAHPGYPRLRESILPAGFGNLRYQHRL